MTIYSSTNFLQKALFQAAKVGHIKLMRELIEEGASPFALDEDNHNAFFYAQLQDAASAAELLEELKREKEVESA